MLDKNKHFRFESDRKLNRKQIGKTTVYLSSIVLIYSIFSNRNQMSLFSRKAYDQLITMTRKKGIGCPCLLVSYSHFSTDRAQYQDKSSMFSMCVFAQAHANDAINYAQ